MFYPSSYPPGSDDASITSPFLYGHISFVLWLDSTANPLSQTNNDNTQANELNVYDTTLLSLTKMMRIPPDPSISVYFIICNISK
jgi:hypothetical protein